MGDNQIGAYAARAIKILAIIAGAPLALVGAMAAAGLFIDNFWAQLGIAVVVLIGVPALIADRLLPDDLERGRGLASDIFAITWLGAAFAVFGAGISLTRPMLHDEAARLDDADFDHAARAVYWLAGHRAGDELFAQNEAATAETPETDDPGAAASGAPETSGAKPGADAGPTPTPGDIDPDADLTPARLFALWAPSVVTVQTGSGPRAGGGTAFVIDDAGTLVTNHHVIDGQSNVKVKLKDGTWADKVELLLSNKDQDIALLRITPPTTARATRLGDSEEVDVGERVISIGNPLGLEHTLTDGLVSSRRKIDGKKMIQMSAPVSPGNSGGPLFNLRGQVIGVTTAQIGAFGAQNLNLAVPINTVKELLADSYPDAVVIGGGGPTTGTW
jgi:S1-C subfamily serine protease